MNKQDRMIDEHDPTLAAPLLALRDSLGQQQAPRCVEKELMQAFARQFPPRRWYHWLSPAQWGIAGGAGSTALVAVLALSLSLNAPPPAGEPQLIASDDGPAFIALQPLERIEQEQDPQMIEADVPRTALATLGVAVNPEYAGDSVRAEMLVGADGSPLALRLVAGP